MKKTLIFAMCSALLTFGLSSCNKSGSSGQGSVAGGYTIKGTIANAQPNSQVFLDEIDNQRVNVIDTATVNADGTFEMTGKVASVGLGRLRVGGRNSATPPMILENSTIEVTLDALNPMTYEVKGSALNDRLRALIAEIQSRRADDNYLKTYADTVSNTLLAYMAVNHLPIENHYDTYKKVLSRLESDMPGSKMTENFASFVKSSASVLNTAVGSEAPNISLTSPDGKTLDLKQLRGKYVLLDFWASWCGPCRRENPNVVAMYKKYNNKGFEIFSVSLDSNKDKWIEAIKKDNLIWKGHVSDLGGWQSAPAALYSVKSIPTTFLLDKEGKIIAKNLRGPALEQKLAELFAGA